MSPNEWHDIDDPGFIKQPAKINTPQSNSKTESPTDNFDSQGKSQDKTRKSLIKLSEGKFLPPAEGVDFNEKCKVRVKVEFLDESARPMKKVTFSLFSKFQDKTDDLCHCVDGYEENGFAEAEMTMYYPLDHRGDGKKAEYFFKASHVRGEKEIESERLTLPYQKKQITIPWIVDCHMHINSGHCAPLPLSKSQVPVPGIGQGGLDLLATVALGTFGNMQKKPTDEIGAKAIEVSKAVLDDPELSYLGEPEKRRRVMICLPMNMDYAHYRGYEGRPIYENIGGEMKCWNEKDGEYKSISKSNIDKWEKYTQQLTRTANSFYSGKGALIPFYHYDPRANLDNWHIPFGKNLIQTADDVSFPKNLPAIGIKMYTALGYQPMDAKLNFPWKEYYGKCQDNQIPIICHGSGKGMPTHDRLVYYDRAHPENTNVNNPTKVAWFNDNFVSPYAWEPVLKEHNKLYLCLAHFGGEEFWNKGVNPVCESYWHDLNSTDRNNWIAGLLHLMKTYPNFYVDISFFMFKSSSGEFFKKALEFDPVVKERILFGTDWWLVNLERMYRGHNYHKYVQNTCEQVMALKDKKFLQNIGINDPKELLAYFMVLNPMKFLQLKKRTPILAKYFKLDETVKKNHTPFELEEWVDSVPEKIEDFYQ
jgi:predicted TIM-barrel fold metal-dependent hydrolase